jgi:hypothetical protein
MNAAAEIVAIEERPALHVHERRAFTERGFGRPERHGGIVGKPQAIDPRRHRNAADSRARIFDFDPKSQSGSR